jgi:muramoyltetrapeptide carboxypeptidase
MRAKALKKGDTIGIFSPSSYVEKDQILKAKKLLEDAGYNIVLHPQYKMRYNQSAGTHNDKINALHELFNDKEINAIFTAGGGNRALHLLDDIDYKLIENNPKILMGFSDVTVLINAIYKKTGLITFHGPVVKSIPKLKNHFNFTLELLSGNKAEYPLENSSALKNGNATGKLIGGNLSVFQYLLATKYAPDTNKAILILEDVNEELSRIDRMLLHIKRTGALENISGIICGEFSNASDTGRPFGFSLNDLLLEHTDGYDIPIITDAPFGHGDKLYTMPIGGEVELNANEKKNTLKITTPAVKIS